MTGVMRAGVPPADSLPQASGHEERGGQLFPFWKQFASQKEEPRLSSSLADFGEILNIFDTL